MLFERAASLFKGELEDEHGFQANAVEKRRIRYCKEWRTVAKAPRPKFADVAEAAGWRELRELFSLARASVTTHLTREFLHFLIF